MCLVCVEIQKGQVLPSSFVTKVQMILKEDPEHEEELIAALTKADQKYLDILEKFLTEELIKNIVSTTIIK